jgi:hypothetical protein
MALYPVQSGAQRDALGLFKRASTFGSGGEGGLVVRLAQDGANNTAVTEIATSGPASSAIHGLLDEQGVTTTFETSLGKYLPANASPVVLGPRTDLASGKMSVWLTEGWFLTDNYDIAVDGYGHSTGLTSGSLLFAKSSGTVGQLTDVAGLATRIHFMQMVASPADLLGTRVTPVPTLGMFAQKALMLIYQANS